MERTHQKALKELVCSQLKLNHGYKATKRTKCRKMNLQYKASVKGSLKFNI